MTAKQQAAIAAGHKCGLSDRGLAALAGVSLSTVKRVRAKLGLCSTCPRNKLGAAGEAYVAWIASSEGRSVSWPPNTPSGTKPPFDLLIDGMRVDVKTARPDPKGRVRFRLPRVRPSFHGEFVYPKDYADDCDVVAFVLLPEGDRAGGVVFMPSAVVPKDVRLHVSAFSGLNWALFMQRPAA